MNNAKVVLITGAAHGIGRATARRFALEGNRLMLADIDAAALHQLADELQATYGPGCCTVCPGDLSDVAYLNQLVASTLSGWQRIDVLVNNAAWRTLETMRTMTVPIWEKTLRICLTAPAFLAQQAVADMERRGATGVIINVSSVMAGRAGGTSPAYVVAKGGLESLTRELAVAYGPRGIRVVGLAPGSVDTALSHDYQDATGQNISQQVVAEVTAFTPVGRAGSPAEIAGVIYWLSTEQAAFITGTTLVADGGLLANFSSYSSKRLQFPTQF